MASWLFREFHYNLFHFRGAGPHRGDNRDLDGCADRCVA